MNTSDPHANLPPEARGINPQKADATIVMIHGRGASAHSILALFDELDLQNCAAIAPQAAGGTWYPYSFLLPVQQNQPYLDSALNRINRIVTDLLAQNIPGERIAILGFSQGACLALEFTARHPRRYGAVMGLTGGLIGPPGTPRNYPGSLAKTPVFLGTSDPDPHVPFERVQETQSVLKRMGAEVELRRYPGLPHTVNDDELTACRTLIQRISKRD